MRFSLLLCLVLLTACTQPVSQTADQTLSHNNQPAAMGEGPGAAMATSGSASGTAQNTPSTSGELTLNGTLVYRERMALPGACDVWVQLVELDSRGRTINILSETIDAASSPNIPLAFSLNYVPQHVSPQGRYALLGRIMHQGETIFATPVPHPVTLPAAEPVRVLTHRFMSDAAREDTSTDPEPGSMAGRRWQLSSLYDVKVEIFDNQPAPHIAFHPDARDAALGRLSGSDGCNLITATYELTEDGLDIRESALTMRMCPEGMEQARALAVALEETDNWRLKGKKLEARQNDRILAVFDAVAL